MKFETQQQNKNNKTKTKTQHKKQEDKNKAPENEMIQKINQKSHTKKEREQLTSFLAHRLCPHPRPRSKFCDKKKNDTEVHRV